MLGLVNNARVEFSSPIGPCSNCRIDFQNFNKLTSGGDAVSSLLGGSLDRLLRGLGSCGSLAVISFVGGLLFLEVLGQQLLVGDVGLAGSLPCTNLACLGLFLRRILLSVIRR